MNALAKVINEIGYLTCLRLVLYSPTVSVLQALRMGFYLDLWLFVANIVPNHKFF